MIFALFYLSSPSAAFALVNTVVFLSFVAVSVVFGSCVGGRIPELTFERDVYILLAESRI